MADLEYEISGHVATITLNRPHRRNAFTFAMLDAWAERLRAADRDPEVRVVVVTGAGGSFCSGVDLEDFGGVTRSVLEEKELLTDRVHQVAYAMDAMSTPVLAAVAGHAIGAGMDMALMADIRIAGTSARFAEAYAKVGLVPGDGGCYYLPAIVGRAEALRLLWTGEVVDAAEALRIGLVSAVHPDEELAERTYELARTIANRPPVAVQLIKRAVRDGARADLRSALDLISSHQAVVRSTLDSREAMAAFTERRDPVYRRQ